MLHPWRNDTLLIDSVQISVKETGSAKVMIACLQRKKFCYTNYWVQCGAVKSFSEVLHILLHNLLADVATQLTLFVVKNSRREKFERCWKVEDVGNRVWKVWMSLFGKLTQIVWLTLFDIFSMQLDSNYDCLVNLVFSSLYIRVFTIAFFLGS